MNYSEIPFQYSPGMAKAIETELARIRRNHLYGSWDANGSPIEEEPEKNLVHHNED